MLINVRQHVYKSVDGHGYYTDSFSSIEGDLGSRMFDKNNREIFSGDKVLIKGDTCEFTVKFVDGNFYVGDTLLCDFDPNEIEVVGRVIE